MRTEIALVGDVHANLLALEGLLELLAQHGRPHAVFLGDYINKGTQSADVVQLLLEQWTAGHVTLLKGNHESVLLEALDSADLAGFLKMGGAMTIRSYVGSRVGRDVIDEFRSALPQAHLDLISQMPEVYETDGLIAQHAPGPDSTTKFRVGAHIPVGTIPRIADRFAHIDTGCGTEGGRLTALMWPSLDYVQVDSRGGHLVR